MTKTWYLVANASTARLYSKEHGGKSLVRLQEFNHPESRETRRELKRDRPGLHQSGTGAQGSFVEPTDPKKNEADRFARELSQTLRSAKAKGDFERLVIVATSTFGRYLTKHLGHLAKEPENAFIEKDYTKVDDKQLAKRLERHIVLT